MTQNVSDSPTPAPLAARPAKPWTWLFCVALAALPAGYTEWLDHQPYHVHRSGWFNVSNALMLGGFFLCNWITGDTFRGRRRMGGGGGLYWLSTVIVFLCVLYARRSDDAPFATWKFLAALTLLIGGPLFLTWDGRRRQRRA